MLYPASFFAFSIAFSFISTLTFPAVFVPFLSVEIKVTYLELSPYSDFFAPHALRFFAFSTCRLVSYICSSASFRVKGHNTLFCKLQRFPVPGVICIRIRKIIHTLFDTVKDFAFFIFNIHIIIFKKYPCFFCFGKCFYRF